MSPTQCRAARTLLCMLQSDLAKAANVPRNVIIDLEVSALPPKPAYLQAMRRALEEAGVEFIEVGGQAGVRLRE